MSFKLPLKFSRLILVSSIFTVGCSTFQKSPEGPQVSDRAALATYARVLATYVNAAGEVDFEGIAAHPQDLETYVRFVGAKKFSDIADAPSLLAHHLNAYNALSMYTVIAKRIPETNAGFKKVRFFYLTNMNIGGEKMSLVTYEKEYIRAVGEDRIHWSLNCMAVSCPRLPREPFTAENLDSQLQAGAVEFFNSEKNVRVDEEHKTLFVSEILDFFPTDFVPKRAPSIPAYVNRFRKIQVPSDYKVKYIPYDWTINNSRRGRHG